MQRGARAVGACLLSHRGLQVSRGHQPSPLWGLSQLPQKNWLESARDSSPRLSSVPHLFGWKAWTPARPELGSSGHPSRHRTSVQVPIPNFLPSCVHLLPPPPCCSRAQRCHCCRNEYCFDGLLLRDFKLGVAVHFGVFPDDCTDLNFEQKGVPSQPCLLQSSPVDNPLGPSASGQIISLGLSVNYQ